LQKVRGRERRGEREKRRHSRRVRLLSAVLAVTTGTHAFDATALPLDLRDHRRVRVRLCLETNPASCLLLGDSFFRSRIRTKVGSWLRVSGRF
jgi:hypothetical protein